ncbi:MAG: hypothetical protein PF961_08130 [Planctomycetota bacterium]|jgi:hypothetical protein|nr:hypothetical protein [Planctomycetota bacterium]
MPVVTRPIRIVERQITRVTARIGAVVTAEAPPMRDPWRLLADSKCRLERLAEILGCATTGKPGSRRLQLKPRAQRAIALSAIAALLGLQIWQWQAQHAASVPLMALPLGLALAGCVLSLASHTWARRVYLRMMPITMLLTWLSGLATMLTYSALVNQPRIETLLIAAVFQFTGAALAGSGLALTLVTRRGCACGQHLLGAGLGLSLGSMPLWAI